jgi:hypothetical protein
MRRMWLVIAALMSLAACGPAPRAPGPEAPPGPSRQEHSLEGSWRVGEIDGRASGDGWPIEVRIGPDRIEARSQCRTYLWRYRLAGDALTTESLPDAGVQCLRPTTMTEGRFAGVMGSATTVEARGETRVLRGPAGMLVLERRGAPGQQSYRALRLFAPSGEKSVGRVFSVS